MKALTFCHLFQLGLIFLVFIGKTQGYVPGRFVQCWDEPVDVVFLLDASTSIWSHNFQKQLNFVKYMVDHFDIGMGPNQIRIGVETFSKFASVHIDLAESTDKSTLKNRIDNIPYSTGDTNIADALRVLLSRMFTPEKGSRFYAKRVAIILTDGTSQNKKATQEAARACRNANIQLFAIGIGPYVDPEELRKIASEPKTKFYYQTANVDALDLIREDVLRQTCQKTEPPLNTEACKNKKADIFFLLDSSASIQIENYKKQLNAIEYIVSRLDIGPLKTRVGVAVFSHEYFPILDFDAGADKRGALLTIRHAKYLGGATETGDALKQVRQGVFNGAATRPGAERILIVCTDGHSKNYEQTEAEARILKESGVKIFAIGIGEQVDRVELEDIASKPLVHFMHTFETFDKLVAKSNLLTDKTCTTEQEPNNVRDECNATQQTDVVFMISNNHFGKWKTKRILKASAEVISTVQSSGVFQFGSIYDSCLSNQDLHVGSIARESQLVSFDFGSIASMIQKLRTESFPSASNGIRQAGLLFLDNTIDLTQRQIFLEAKRSTFQNVDIYAVVIGEGVDRRLVESLVLSKDRIIYIYSYDDLISYLPSQFTKRLCKKTHGNFPFKPEIS